MVRTVPQAEGLNHALADLGRTLTAVLVFDVDEDELVRRLGARTVCDACQTPYTGLPVGTACPKCGGRLVRRADDEPAAVRQRLAVYRAQTAPVIQWYVTHGTPVLSIDAVGTPDQVRTRVTRALGRSS